MGDLPIHQLLQQLSLNDLLWDFDAVSFYLSARSGEKSIYPRIESGYSFTPDMNDGLVKKFNEGNFTQRSAILKIKNFTPKNLIVQHLAVTQRVNKCEISRLTNGYIVDILTSVDIQEIV